MLPIHKTKTTVFNYNDIPAGYYFDRMVNGGPVQKFWHWEKFAQVAFKIANNKTVLDLGCGPGSFLHVLSQLKTGLTATGVDMASSQIEFAQKNITSSNNKISFQTVDFNLGKLPFSDASADYITCIEVIEHIHPYLAYKTLIEARRILKPGGKLLLTTPNYRSLWPLIEMALEKMSPVKYHDQHISKFTPNAFAKFIEAAGFSLNSMSSFFVISPFMAPLGIGLAKNVMHLEQKLSFMPGSLLMAEAERLEI